MKTTVNNLKLNQKFTLAVFCVILVPVALLAVVLFSNMKRIITEDQTSLLERSLAQMQAGAEKTVDLCNMTTQVFQNSPNLRAFLRSAKAGATPSAGALMEFYRTDVASFERMINANPYLYQVRIYYDNPNIAEMMPLLYRSERMRRLSWAQGDWAPGAWQFDYADTLFPLEVATPAAHLMSLVTTITDYDFGALAVMEVAVRMSDLMPGLFDARAGQHAGFLLNTGTFFSASEEAGFWNRHGASLGALFPPATQEIETRSTLLDGGEVWVTSVPLGALGGRYIVVTSPGAASGRLAVFERLYTVSLLVLLLILALSVNAIVKAMLRRLYTVFKTIGTLQAGDLSVRVPDLGGDEVGLLAGELNRLLSHIDRLMKENIDRQLLAKSSEIRALQSQINAHFIYNVLESIKMMAEVDEKYEIADAIQSLGGLLRYSMHWVSPEASVLEEVENVRDYLSLINLRFDYSVTLRCDIPEELLPLRIPKMTLQPLVENAVVHGIEFLAQDAFLDLSAARDSGGVTLALTDYGTGMEEATLAALKTRLAGTTDPLPGRSIGLKNVQDRLVMAFGPGAGLELESRPGVFTRVSIRLPSAPEGGGPG